MTSQESRPSPRSSSYGWPTSLAYATAFCVVGGFVLILTLTAGYDIFVAITAASAVSTTSVTIVNHILGIRERDGAESPTRDGHDAVESADASPTPEQTD